VFDTRVHMTPFATTAFKFSEMRIVHDLEVFD
jgi:hypothetical protein